MNTVVVISIFCAVVFLLFMIGIPFKPIQFLGRTAVKLLLGALMLFLLNAVGEFFNLHIPINAATTVVSGLLGIPGIAALVIIKYTMGI